MRPTKPARLCRAPGRIQESGENCVKTVLCFGDSNTYGYVPGSGGERYGADVRWPRRLGALLGEAYEVVEEGLNGRTTAFDDRIEPYRCGLDAILPCIMSHAPVHLLIVMLGTNDTKDRYHVRAEEIGYGLEELVMKVAGYHQFRAQKPKMLLVAPVPLGDMSEGIEFSEASRQKSLRLSAVYAGVAQQFGCAFLDAGAVVPQLGCDNTHFTPEGHRLLAQALAPEVRRLLE